MAKISKQASEQKQIKQETELATIREYLTGTDWRVNETVSGKTRLEFVSDNAVLGSLSVTIPLIVDTGTKARLARADKADKMVSAFEAFRVLFDSMDSFTDFKSAVSSVSVSTAPLMGSYGESERNTALINGALDPLHVSDTFDIELTRATKQSTRDALLSAYLSTKQTKGDYLNYCQDCLTEGIHGDDDIEHGYMFDTFSAIL